MRVLGLLLVLIVLSSAGVSGCGQCRMVKPEPAPKQESMRDILPTDGSIARIRQNGVVVVGIAPQAPWSLRKGDDLVGFDVELARRLAEDLGVQVKLVTTPQAELLPGLLDAKYDIIISGFSVTPERALFVSFSDPVDNLGFELLAHVKFRGLSVKGFDQDRMQVGAVNFTVAEAVARERLPKAKQVPFQSYDELLKKLLAGEISAAVLPDPIATAAAVGYPRQVTVVTKEPLANRPEAIALRREDRDLKDYLDSWVTFYRASGWIEERRNFWFRDVSWAKQLDR